MSKRAYKCPLSMLLRAKSALFLETLPCPFLRLGETLNIMAHLDEHKLLS